MNWKDFDAVRETRRQRGRPFILAHRGAPKLEPENTLASFALALDQGADCLETDLHFSADDELVLLHDATVDRTTGQVGPVREFTRRQLGQMEGKSPLDGRLTDRGIPALDELIQLTGAQTPLVLELKDPLFLKEEYADKLVETLTQHNMLGKAAIISFHLDYVLTVRRVCPAIPIGIVSYKTLRPPKVCELAGPVWPLLLVNPFFVAQAHRQGSLVAPLDPDPESRVRLYNRMGVDAVLANDPAGVLAALK